MSRPIRKELRAVIDQRLAEHKTKIAEMSQPWIDIETKLVNQAVTVLGPIVKLMIFDSPENYNHWRGEIAGNLKQVPKLKGKNVLPNADKMYKAIYDSLYDEIEYFIKGALKEETELKVKNYKIEDIQEVFVSYFKWVTSVLSKEARITDNNRVYIKLDELGVPGGNN